MWKPYTVSPYEYRKMNDIRFNIEDLKEEPEVKIRYKIDEAKLVADMYADSPNIFQNLDQVLAKNRPQLPPKFMAMDNIYEESESETEYDMLAYGDRGPEEAEGDLDATEDGAQTQETNDKYFDAISSKISRGPKRQRTRLPQRPCRRQSKYSPIYFLLLRYVWICGKHFFSSVMWCAEQHGKIRNLQKSRPLSARSRHICFAVLMISIVLYFLV